jgi:hypothetical protein
MNLHFLNRLSKKKKSSNIKFHQNPSSRSRVIPCGRTDITKLIVAFRNCANAPKIKPKSSHLFPRIAAGTHLEDSGIRAGLKLMFKKQDRRAWAGFIWLRTARSDGLLLTRWWTLRFHCVRWTFWQAKDLFLSSQEGLRSMALAS